MNIKRIIEEQINYFVQNVNMNDAREIMFTNGTIDKLTLENNDLFDIGLTFTFISLKLL